MKVFHFERLLQAAGWHSDVRITIDALGQITNIQTNTRPEKDDERIRGWTLPGFQNAHSHAFQYAMAGQAEIHTPGTRNDSFWSWRQRMYELALSISPEDLEAIATCLYAEMLRHGYTSVAEFHYLHHGSDGKVYSDPAEMGHRLLNAASRAGMRITLIPIFYQKGGFGIEPESHQRRFISADVDRYMNLIDRTRQWVEKYPLARMGFGIHSLRAVDAENCSELFGRVTAAHPFHIHVSEQTREVAQCREAYGTTPIQWMMDHLPVDDRFHLVHATHITPSELTQLVQTGAHVVLCPSTEGNLGDGFFPLEEFHRLGGQWSIGTDSHVGLSPMEEIRLLDYGQRLQTHRRDQMTSSDQTASGSFAIDMALRSGRAAMGIQDIEYFDVGQSLDAIVLDPDQPLLQVRSDSEIDSTFLYAGDPTFIQRTLVAGDWKVSDRQHRDMHQIRNTFVEVLKKY